LAATQAQGYDGQLYALERETRQLEPDERQRLRTEWGR
jgi:hypothetical protein